MADALIDLKTAGSSGGVLLPYQRRWVEDRSPVKVIEKSRRVGLSWAEAADAVRYAALKGNGTTRNVWYIGYTKDMAFEFINDCANWAKNFNEAISAIEEYDEPDSAEGGSLLEGKKIQAFRITFKSGWRITALSSRPSNLRGKQGRIIIDEAAFHPDLKGLLKAAMAFLMWGGEVRIISTHNGVDNEFNNLIKDIRAGKKPYGLHKVTLDDALTDGLYRRICLVLKREWTQAGQDKWREELRDFYGDDAEEELDCVPKNSGGAWLSRVLIEARMADRPVIRWEPPANFEVWEEQRRIEECENWMSANLRPLLAKLDPAHGSGLGWDFGRTGDLSVGAPFQYADNLARKFPFILELRNVPFQQQQQVAFALMDGLPNFQKGAFDARGNGQYLAEVAMQRYGTDRIERVMLSEKWYAENTAPFKAAFEDGTIEIPKDENILNDLRGFQVIKGIPRMPDSRIKDINSTKTRHGDAGIALLLAYFASQQEFSPIEFQSAGERESFGAFSGYAGDLDTRGW